MSFAELIAASGKIRTTCVADEVPGVYKANEKIHGTFNPDGVTNIERYGKGFGKDFKQDLSVLPAISMVPDADNANHGLVGGSPGAEGGSLNRSGSGERIDDDVCLALSARFGVDLPVGYHATAQDVADLGYCVDFTTEIFYPLFRGTVAPTPQAKPSPVPAPPAVEHPDPTPPALPLPPNSFAEEIPQKYRATLRDMHTWFAPAPGQQTTMQQSRLLNLCRYFEGVVKVVRIPGF